MRRLRPLARRIIPRRLRNRLRSVGWPPRAQLLAADLRLVPRNPRVGLELFLGDLADPQDIARLPALERAERVRPSKAIRRRRAELLNRAGEPTAAHLAWQKLARRGNRPAQRRVRIRPNRRSVSSSKAMRSKGDSAVSRSATPLR